MSSRTKNGFHAKDFSIDTDRSNLSAIELSGRYPEIGYAMNTKSEMVVYILEGKIMLDRGAKKTLNKGAVALIKKGEKYFWFPKENTTLLIFSSPPWTSEQQRLTLDRK